MAGEKFGPHPLSKIGENEAGNEIAHEETSGAQFHLLTENPSEQLAVSALFSALGTTRILSDKGAIWSEDADELSSSVYINEDQLIDFYAQALLIAELTKDVDHDLRVRKIGSDYEIIGLRNVGFLNNKITLFDFGSAKLREYLKNPSNLGSALAWATGRDIAYNKQEYLPLADPDMKKKILERVTSKQQQLTAQYATEEGAKLYAEVTSRLDPFATFIGIDVFRDRIQASTTNIARILGLNR